MKLVSLRLPSWAASFLIVAASLFGATSIATAQEEPAPEETPAGAESPAPGSDAAAADAAADAAAAPDAAAPEAAPAETVETVPVTTGETEPAAPPAKDDPNATELDTITVTGSRIRRSDYETESPVLVIKREDIEKTGLVSIGDILQNLPQAGAALSRAFNNGGNGATEIDLRNLGSNRVLVLVNGRRWVGGVSSFNTSGVDLNTIPISVIDSIEILKDGASAIYGSDAIAGVINIKTRRDYVGAELRTHFEATDKGDGMGQLLSFSGGTVAGKTSAFFDVSYVNQGPLYSKDREESSIPKAGIPRDNVSRGSRFMEYGNTIFIPTPTNASAINAAAGMPAGGVLSPCPDVTLGLGLTEGDAPGVVPVIPLPVGSVVTLCDLTLDRAEFANGNVAFKRVDMNEDAYNFAPVNYLITPSERSSLYGQISHQITDSIRFSSEALYNVRKSKQQLAETPDGLGDLLGVKPFDLGYVASTNPYNPTNPESPYYIPGAQAQDIGKGDPGAGLVGLGAVLRRFRELGPRQFSQDVDTARIGLGLDGGFDGNDLDGSLGLLDRFFSWDAGFVTSENRLSSRDAGLINNDRLARASGPVEDCVPVEVGDPSDGVIGNTTASTPPPAAAGCVPFDWFGGPNAPTQEQLNYIQYTALDQSKQRQRIAYANISTEVPEAQAFLAGPLGIAGGLEFRQEFFSSQPDPLKAMQTSSTNAQGPTKGSYEVSEAYTEVRLPLLADKKFVQELEVSLAARFSDYSSFGENTSGKLGLLYKPFNDLLLRTTYSTAFRAPAITDLYLGQSTSFPTVEDPCEDPNTPNEETNCEGIAGGAATSQLPVVFGGNPNLDPETAKTLSVGLVYSPEFIKDFNFYLDWYSITIDDFISPLGPDQVLALCYSSASPSYCDAVERNDAGQLTKVNAIFQNFATVEVEGVDFNWDWILPLPEMMDRFGQFQWVLDAAYASKFIVTSPGDGGDTSTQLVGIDFGGQGGIPRWKVNTGLNWSRGDWEGTWTVRYIHRLTESCDDGFQDPGAQGQVLENPTKINSLAEYGLCSNPGFDATFGGPTNELAATFYNDVTASYSLPSWNSKFTFGVNNILDQDPPRSSTAFADSYDKSLYDPWGSRTPYARFQVNF